MTTRAKMAPGRYEPSPGVLVKMSCHHRRAGQLTACGSCYARAIDALREIREDPTKAADITARVFAAIYSEVPPDLVRRLARASGRGRG
jgi:hypothetical protein